VQDRVADGGLDPTAEELSKDNGLEVDRGNNPLRTTNSAVVASEDWHSEAPFIAAAFEVPTGRNASTEKRSIGKAIPNALSFAQDSSLV